MTKADLVAFVPQGVEFLGVCPHEEVNLLRHIELAGRVCYKSEGKMTEDSYIPFVHKIIQRGHMSVLGHSNICFKLTCRPGKHDHVVWKLLTLLNDTHQTPYFKVVKDDQSVVYIASSLRGWLNLFEQISDHLETPIFAEFKRNYPTIWEWITGVDGFNHGHLHHADPRYLGYDSIASAELVTDLEQLELLKLSPNTHDLPMFTFRFICDRGISHEIVRHTTLCFSQESTRYCVYNDKIRMIAVSDPPYKGEEEGRNILRDYLYTSADGYRRALSFFAPQLARNVLPQSLRTEVVASGRMGHSDYSLSESGWAKFFSARTHSSAHPAIIPLAEKAQSLLNQTMDSVRVGN